MYLAFILKVLHFCDFALQKFCVTVVTARGFTQAINNGIFDFNIGVHGPLSTTVTLVRALTFFDSVGASIYDVLPVLSKQMVRRF